MKKCIRCYVIKKILHNALDLLCVLGFFASLVGSFALVGFAFRWIMLNYPALGLGIAGSMLWVWSCYAIMAIKGEIEKLIAEARRECGE